jgi:hypothetical protein
MGLMTAGFACVVVDVAAAAGVAASSTAKAMMRMMFPQLREVSVAAAGRLSS